jgi:hypothetical protein
MKRRDARRRVWLRSRDAVKEQNQRVAKLGSRIAARFAKAGLTAPLPELRGQRPRSVKFGK